METKDQTIQNLTSKKKELTERRERLMRPVQELDKEIMALSVAIAVFLRDETPAEPSGFPLRKLRNMTQTQALLEIAKYNGGTVKSLEVKAILIAAKLMRNTKNAAGMVNGVITRSGVFERIGRGEYRLIETSVSMLNPRPEIFEARPSPQSITAPSEKLEEVARSAFFHRKPVQ